MEKKDVKLEVLTWLVMLVPLVHLAVSWNSLPDQVPVHFNLDGEVDRWGSKYYFLTIILGVTIVTYFFLKFLPYLDPKQKIEYMGSKFTRLRFVLILFLASISLFLTYNALNPATFNMNLMFVLLGVFFIVLGNYFQAIKPNYFIGIRTPWTLESENVWKKTHRIGGRLWMLAGLLLVLLAFTEDKVISRIFFIIIMTISVGIPIVYSFIESKKEQKSKHLHH
jgi:uncharacterized membrane protein